MGMAIHTPQDCYKDLPVEVPEVSPFLLQIEKSQPKAQNPARLSCKELENFDVYS